eukprot:748130-Hanusia_phi.AAC.2
MGLVAGSSDLAKFNVDAMSQSDYHLPPQAANTSGAGGDHGSETVRTRGPDTSIRSCTTW